MPTSDSPTDANAPPPFESWPIRSPTGRAWMVWVFSFVIAAELIYEIRQEQPIVLFHMPFTNAELLPWVLLASLLTGAALIWLLSLYFRPGSIAIDPTGPTFHRVRRPFLRRQTLSFAATELRTRIVFFSAQQRARHVFKRIELFGPDYEEVLLFTDLKRGELLAQTLIGHEAKLGGLEVDVEQVDASEASASPAEDSRPQVPAK